MLTRLMFGGGGTVQVLLMQAVKKTAGFMGISSTIGYSIAQGSLSPNYIYHQGEKYEITYFRSLILSDETGITFKDAKILNGERIIVEVNGTVHTFVKNNDSGSYTCSVRIFTTEGTYTIKILSIQ